MLLFPANLGYIARLSQQNRQVGGMVVYTCNPSTWGRNRNDAGVQTSPVCVGQDNSETLSLKTTKTYSI